MDEISVNIKHVSKKFRLYHENRTSIYESLLGYFSRKKHYETFQALDDITFDVKKGEMFGIIGKNGSGKTTLLRILSHIYQPDCGSVDIKGTIIPVLALGLGFHPELTATTNIVQSGTLLGFSKKEISDNTLKRKMGFFKSFLNWCIKNGYSTNLAFKDVIIKGRETSHVSLTTEEVDTLAGLELDEALSYYRDLFLIGVYSGQRYSDYTRFNKKFIDGNNIVIRATKTSQFSYIPIMNIYISTCMCEMAL